MRRARRAASITTPAAAPGAERDGGNVDRRCSNGTRLRSSTGLTKSSTGQPRSTAILRSALSGLTAYGWPTASSIGTSVAESEYAKDAARS